MDRTNLTEEQLVQQLRESPPDLLLALAESQASRTQMISLACVYIERCKSLQERVRHLERSLRFIAQVCVQDPDAAQFALLASENPPTVFPPTETDYYNVSI